jgi:type II secretory pathway pseudopilin PulG
MCWSIRNILEKGRKSRKEDGFTLLEFIAAFTILTLFLSAGLAAIAVAVRGDRQAVFLTQAAMLAKSKLGAAGIDFPLRPGMTSGRFDNGYVWQAEVRNYRTVAIDEDRRVAGLWVQVTVADPRSSARTFSLDSVEIVHGTGP